MNRLVFGDRARRRAARRARYKRLSVWAWLLTVISMAFGAPGGDVGITLWREVLHSASLSAESTGVETSETAAALLKFRSASFETRPTPTPTPTEQEVTTIVAAVGEPAPAPPPPPAAAPGSIQAIIYEAAEEFGIDGGWLLSIASCESGLNPNAYNPAGYHGLFQFDSGTWAAYGYGSIYDPVAQARTAARLLAAGQASRWPSCT